MICAVWIPSKKGHALPKGGMHFSNIGGGGGVISFAKRVKVALRDLITFSKVFN